MSTIKRHKALAAAILFSCLMGSAVGDAHKPLACEVLVPAEAGRVGKSIFVDYVIRWDAGEACAVFPLEPEMPEWGAARLVSSHAGQEGDIFFVRQTVEYTAESPGTHSLPKLRIPVSSGTLPPLGRFEQAPSAYVEAPAATITVKSEVPRRIIIWSAPLVVFCVFLAALAVFWRRKNVTEDDGEFVEDYSGRLHAARRRRLDGDYYACYRQLLDLCRLLSAHTPAAVEIASRLEGRVRQVGFGAVRPPEDEVEGFFRDLERLTAQLPKTSHDAKEKLS